MNGHLFPNPEKCEGQLPFKLVMVFKIITMTIWSQDVVGAEIYPKEYDSYILAFSNFSGPLHFLQTDFFVDTV